MQHTGVSCRQQENTRTGALEKTLGGKKAKGCLWAKAKEKSKKGANKAGRAQEESPGVQEQRKHKRENAPNLNF